MFPFTVLRTARLSGALGGSGMIETSLVTEEFPVSTTTVPTEAVRVKKCAGRLDLGPGDEAAAGAGAGAGARAGAG